jgi:hypothetical protein
VVEDVEDALGAGAARWVTDTMRLIESSRV